MTQDLEVVFAELGMSQYLDAFLEQGFDCWDTVLDITESDLDALGVKLGHRRKLQRRIANARGIAPDAFLASPIRSSIEESKPDQHRADLVGRHDVQPETVAQKRKYRRHPKPDENSPERPPSAYVLFSNKMREDLKGQNLSFTEIAKLVGENWQSISPYEKEPFERQAQQVKEKYQQELAEYKKTPEYRRYAQYLQEFKQKQASQSQGVWSRKRTSPRCSLDFAASPDVPTLTRHRSWKVKDASKRPKLEPMRSLHGSSTSATPTSVSGSLGGGSGSGSDSQPGSEPPPTRQQRGSVVSMLDLQFSGRTASTSQQQSIDEPLISPTLTQFDNGFVTSPHDAHGRNHRQWRDPVKPSDNKHQHLPSLSDMFDSRKMTGLPQSPDGNGYGQYPSGHHRHERHERPRPEGGRDLPRSRPPALRDEHSSNGSSSSSSSVYSSVPGRPSKDASLPIHALLSNKSSSSPSPPSYGQPPSKPQQPEPRRPFSSHGSRQSSNGNGIDPYPPAASPVDEEMSLADPPPPRESSSSRRGKNESDLDGMSALLRAGEIVGRRHR